MKSKLIKREGTDMILIDTDGEIIYDDIGNYRYFSLGMNSAKGKNVRELFLDLEEDYPLLLAARDGVTSENFEWELTTRRNIQFKKSEVLTRFMTEIKLSAQWNLPASFTAKIILARLNSIQIISCIDVIIRSTFWMILSPLIRGWNRSRPTSIRSRCRIQTC